MTPALRLTIAAAIAAGLAWWTGPRDLPGMEWGTTLSIWAVLTAVVFGAVSWLEAEWGDS